MNSILFVCTGNICRSPLAEGLCRVLLAERATGVTIDSAGMQARDGLAPEPHAVTVAAERGADISALRSRRFVVADFTRAGIVIAMDTWHLDFLQALAPRDWGGYLDLLRDDRGRGIEVGDPYGNPIRSYRRAADLIERGLPALLARVAAVP